MGKGKDNEREARLDILEEVGWETTAVKHTKFGETDFFGLFDLIAFKEGNKPLFAQVRTNRPREITSFHEQCADKQVPFDYVDVEMWTRYDREGWRIDKITPDGATTILDEREYDCNIGDKVRKFKSCNISNFVETSE